MRLDYRRPKEVRNCIGKRVLITKYSSRAMGDEPGEKLNAVAIIKGICGEVIEVKFEQKTYLERYDRSYIEMHFWWIDIELDPDGNY